MGTGMRMRMGTGTGMRMGLRQGQGWGWGCNRDRDGGRDTSSWAAAMAPPRWGPVGSRSRAGVREAGGQLPNAPGSFSRCSVVLRWGVTPPSAAAGPVSSRGPRQSPKQGWGPCSRAGDPTSPSWGGRASPRSDAVGRASGGARGPTTSLPYSPPAPRHCPRYRGLISSDANHPF